MKNLFEQGDLDGLCGLYSLINASEHLSNSKCDCAKLFAAAVKLLEKKKKLADFILEGMTHPNLQFLITHVFEETLGNRQIPFHKEEPTLAEFWNSIVEFFDDDEKRCVLIGLEGKVEHWTVVTAATDKTFTLSDSDGMKRLYRKNCTVGDAQKSTRVHELFPKQTYFFTFPSS